MGTDEGHIERLHLIVKRYQDDKEVLKKLLRVLASQTENRGLQPSHLPKTSNSDWEKDVQIIIAAGQYFPPSALLYLEREIICREITSRHFILHLPHSWDSAVGNTSRWKENLNCENKTKRHQRHTLKKQRALKLLQKYIQSSSIGATLHSSDTGDYEEFQPDERLQKVFEHQAVYLYKRDWPTPAEASYTTTEQPRGYEKFWESTMASQPLLGAWARAKSGTSSWIAAARLMEAKQETCITS
ncbi:hypothetical protein CC79DRAFT_1368704 [Sarocladium strictum]